MSYQNCTNHADGDIYFNARFYPTRTTQRDDGVTIVVGTGELAARLFDIAGNYVNRDARRVDESIACYVETDKLQSLNDEDFQKYVFESCYA